MKDDNGTDQVMGDEEVQAAKPDAAEANEAAQQSTDASDAGN